MKYLLQLILLLTVSAYTVSTYTEQNKQSIALQQKTQKFIQLAQQEHADAMREYDAYNTPNDTTTNIAILSGGFACAHSFINHRKSKSDRTTIPVCSLALGNTIYFVHLKNEHARKRLQFETKLQRRLIFKYDQLLKADLHTDDTFKQ